MANDQHRQFNENSRWQAPYEAWENPRTAARENRKNPTRAERKLWTAIKGDRLGVTFRRQHSIGIFIVDFYCAEKDLVIEVDGPIHDFQVQEDATRQEFLEQKGLTVIRFRNDEVLGDLNGVLAMIQRALELHL